MALTYVINSPWWKDPGVVTAGTDKYVTESYNIDWGEPWPEQTFKKQTNKSPVQEPVRKKNLRYLNRPA